MSADPTSLENLHDIVVPGPAPWWPPAPGWYWVMAFVGLLGAVLLWRAIVHWQRNRYRREALAELARIEAVAVTVQSGEKSPEKTLPALADLLKRTALTAYPRAQVAALTGPAWFAFLDQTGGTAFSAGLGAALAQGNYHTGERNDAAGRAADIAREIRRWIRQHGRFEGAQPENAIPAAHTPSGNKRSTAEAS